MTLSSFTSTLSARLPHLAPPPQASSVLVGVEKGLAGVGQVRGDRACHYTGQSVPRSQKPMVSGHPPCLFVGCTPKGSAWERGTIVVNPTS